MASANDGSGGMTGGGTTEGGHNFDNEPTNSGAQIDMPDDQNAVDPADVAREAGRTSTGNTTVAGNMGYGELASRDQAHEGNDARTGGATISGNDVGRGG